MKVYLASLKGMYKYFEEYLSERIFVLESFYYIKQWMLKYIKNHWDFLLDSGAFTFMQNSKKSVDWNDYILKYADFINTYDIKQFFGLDIDCVVGIKEVERLREKLETLTSKKCIPVFHKSRGKDYWTKMIKEYDYVAIGGIVTKEIKKKEQYIFEWFLDTAKKENCKVHGLGYTNLTGLKKYHFYSVDSSSWLYGNLSGTIYKFNGKTLLKEKRQGRLKTKESANNNFKEWLKFQRYADEHL